MEKIVCRLYSIIALCLTGGSCSGMSREYDWGGGGGVSYLDLNASTVVFTERGGKCNNAHF